ncbi:hypothetical protein [Arhodomonas sp. AD133]|uniref:hypothetical protein n=1 Tax=Arhodomonas sp. AD133 TaxID=3415009 RepID=UPI003EC066E2
MYYDAYGDGSVPLVEGMTFEARSGQSTHGADYAAGAGTVFLKRSDAAWGELHVDAGGIGSEGDSTTTLRSIGRHRVTGTGVDDADRDRYWVAVEGQPWTVPDPEQWELGLRGLFVSLDADDPDAPLFQVVDNTENRLVIESDSSIDALVGDELIGVVRLDRLVTSAKARLIADDRLVADELVMDDVRAVSGIAEVKRGETHDFDTLTVDSNRALVGTVTAKDVIVDGAELGVEGALEVSGSITIRNGGRLWVPDLETPSGVGVTLDSGTLAVDGSTVLGGSLDIQGESTVRTSELTVTGSLTQGAGTLTLAVDDTIDVGGDFRLDDGAVLTVPPADVDARQLYAVAAEVAGTFEVAQGATLDLVGTGYPQDHAVGFQDLSGVAGSHAAPGGDEEPGAVYGDFRQASTAGAGGEGSAGGGMLRVTAQTAVVDGEILADGAATDDTYVGSAAGGSVFIDTEALQGMGTIRANGGEAERDPTGSGGRIALEYASGDISQLTLDARGGRLRGDREETRGGAGTVTLTRSGALPELRLANDGASGRMATRLRSVGHWPVATSEVDGSRCRITVDGSPWTAPADAGDGLGLVGLMVDLAAGDRQGPLHTIRDNTDDSIWVDADQGQCPQIGSHLVGVIRLARLSVTQGASLKTPDRVSVDEPGGLVDEGQSTFGDLMVAGDSWAAVDWPEGTHLSLMGDQRVASMVLDGWHLDIDGELVVDGPLTVRGSDSALTSDAVRVRGDAEFLDVGRRPLIEGTDTLGAADTAESIRIHRFTLSEPMDFRVKAAGIDGAVEFFVFRDDGDLTEDDVIGGSSGHSNTQTYESGADGLTAGDYLLAVGEGDISSDTVISGTSDWGGATYTYSVTPIANVGASHVEVPAIEVDGKLRMDSAMIAARDVKAPAGLQLTNGARLHPPAVSDPADPAQHRLSVSAESAEVSVDATSEISVADLVTQELIDANAHGADSETAEAYGDFRAPSTPGASEAEDVGSRAGGYLDLTAQALTLSGRLNVSAGVGAGDASGGAIAVDVGTLSGSGAILAQGGNSNGQNTYESSAYPAGSGGRIALYVGERSGFRGQVSAAGGVSSYDDGNAFVPGNTGGAGTIYWLDRATAEGMLEVSNTEAVTGQVRDSDWPTRLRDVGRHDIDSVTRLSDGRIRVEVAGEPWQAPADAVDGLGLVGLEVDLNAADEAGPFHEIVDNGPGHLILAADGQSGQPAHGSELIGVVRLHALALGPGGRLRVDDRLVIEDGDGVSVDPASLGLVAGSFSGWSGTAWPEGFELDVGGDHDVGSLVVSDYSLAVDGELRTTDVSVGSDGAISADRLRGTGEAIIVGGELDVDTLHMDEGVTLTESSARVKATHLESGGLDIQSGKLITEDVSVHGNARVGDGGVLTVPEASIDPFHVPVLDMAVEGTIDVARLGKVDLTGKGYPAGIPRPDIPARAECAGGSYGGLRKGESVATCTVGRYDRIRHPGAPGQGRGGGLATIRADLLRLDGAIVANAAESNGSGSGGAVVLDVGIFEGSASGRLSANGYGWYGTGTGGGRLAMRTEADGYRFQGTVETHGGVGSVAGAGTALVQEGEALPRLVIGNGGVTADASSTPFRSVRHSALPDGSLTIESVSEASPGRWRISVGEATGAHDVLEDHISGARGDSARYLDFTLGAAHEVEISVKEAFTGKLFLYREEGGAWQYQAYTWLNENAGYWTRWMRSLEAGTYRVVVASGRPSSSAALDTGSYGSGVSGDIHLAVHTDGGIWKPSNAGRGTGLDGLHVDLDASDAAGPLYEIVSNGEAHLIVASDDPLDASALVGNEIIGVHRFRELDVTGGASLDAGGDRVIVEDIVNSTVERPIQNVGEFSEIP